MRLLSVLLVVILVLVGCGRVDVDELPGTYFVEYEFGSEMLSLERDGEYVQYVTVGDSSTLHRGRWSYDSDSRAVILVDALLARGDFGTLNPSWRSPAKGRTIRSAHRWFFWSPLTLGVDEERRFRKISE